MSGSGPPSPCYFNIPVGPYRFLDQLSGDLRARLPEGARIREALFIVRPFEAAPDPLFGPDEEARRVARE
ncbi:MAG: hypothetical protein N3B68_00005, partial [Anaerolineae bacterium]|nr:hypothetical protein [Anaerolineae bacterium]